MSTTTTSHSARSTSPCEGLRTHALLDNRLVQDIVAYLSANNGPDDQGRAHHKKVRLPIAEVEAAIDILNAQGQLLWLRPYHISPAPTGSWHDQRLVDEVLQKRCNQLVTTLFDNDLPRFCCEVTQKALLGPLSEEHSGRIFEVKMGSIAHLFHDSPYEMVQRYLLTRGLRDEYSWFQPYHMTIASMGTWQNETIIDEVLKKQCDKILKEHFGGDLALFLCEVTRDALLCPFKETHAGREISVSMHRISNTFGDSAYKMLQRYLEIIGRADECSWFKPFHMSCAPNGTWQLQEYLDTIVKMKCDTLVKERFGGDLTRFCCEVEAEYLLSPLTEAHAGREISVSMTGIRQAFRGSPYAIVQRYLHLEGRADEYAWLKPYHMSMAPLGTWKDPKVVDEVLKNKCDVLRKEKFGGDLIRFCCEVTKDDLLEPLKETHAGRDILISMGAVGSSCSNSPYAMALRYLQILGLEEEFAWFKPYHRSVASSGTWQQQEYQDEILVRKCEAVLREMYGNDLVRFCCEVTQNDLLSPLVEIHGGREIEVSMTGIAQRFLGSPHGVVKEYLRRIGRAEEFSWFRPYHMTMAPLGTWQDRATVDEVLRKKCDAVVQQNFGGDLTRFCCEVIQDNLQSPLREVHAGKEISVSMGTLVSTFPSHYAMLQRYLEIIGRMDEYAWFKPHHMLRASSNTWTDQETVDTVLRKKCDLLLKEKFGNDLSRLCYEVDLEDLRSPLLENHLGRDISVSMRSVCGMYGHSPYLLVRQYFKLLGRSFPYTSACFMGSPETRKRRQQGDLSVADLRRIKRSDGTYDTGQYGFKNFTAGDKTAIREFMLEAIEDALKDRSVHYLGLETEQFISLRALYERVNLSPRNSLVVERDPRIFAAMKTTAQMLPSRERRSIGAINLTCNTLEGALTAAKRGSFQFNVVNLDYLGHMSTEKELTLQLLLEKNLLDTESLVFITLQDTELARSRAHRAGYGDDQAQALDREIDRLAHLTGHSALRLAMLHYNGGSGGKVGSQMLWVAYSIKRNTPP